MHIRYQLIILHLRNYTNVHISKIMELNQHTVGTYINSYKKYGINGLVIGKPTGRPRFLTAEQEEKLYAVITTKTPDEVGFGHRKNWNANIARKWGSDNLNATLLLGEGTDYKVIQSRLGHSDIGTTLNIYSHVTMEMQKSASKKIASLLSPKQKNSQWNSGSISFPTLQCSYFTVAR